MTRTRSLADRARDPSLSGDTTPELGGNLDVNGNAIVSTSNGNIAITPNGSGKVVLDGLSWPTSDGSSNQLLKTDGSGSLSFATVNSDVVSDTTPQLGGSLDVNGNSIVSASNGNIAITPNGSGKIILDGLSFPTADGSANTVLKTDGSGNLSFSSVSGLSGSGIQQVQDDTSPVLGGTLNANSNQITNVTTIGGAKGIFTSSATGQLTLNSTSSDYMLEFQRNGTSEWWLKASSSGFTIHENGSSDHLTVGSGGVIGINETPSNARGGYTDLLIGQGDETGQGSTQPQIELYNSSASWAINNDSTNSNQMGFHYNNGSSWSQKLALTSTSANFAGAVDVNGDITFSANNHVLSQNNSRNLQFVSGGSGSDVGIFLKDAGSNAFVQLYGYGSGYGFLDGAWSNWDLKKERGGAMDLYGSDAVIRLNSSGNNDRGIEFNHGSAGSTPAGQTKKASIMWNEGNANFFFKNFRTDANISYANIGFFTGGGTYTTPALRLNINYAGAIGFSQSGNTTSTNQDPNNMEYGSSGQVLTSKGNLAPPQWEDAGGGNWSTLSSQTTTSVSSWTYSVSTNKLYRLSLIHI